LRPTARSAFGVNNHLREPAPGSGDKSKERRATPPFLIWTRAAVLAEHVAGQEIRDQLVQTRPVPDNRHRTQVSIAFEHVEDLVRRVISLQLLTTDRGGPARLLQKLRCLPRPNKGAAQNQPDLGHEPQDSPGGTPEALFTLGCQRTLGVVRPEAP
jgi:hypothetical protein